MERNEILQELTSYLENDIYIACDVKITQDVDLFRDLGLDSLDTIELIMHFENRFGININDDAVENITTIKEVVDYLEPLVK